MKKKSIVCSDKKLPENICLKVAMLAGCKRCEINAEM